MSLVVVLHIYGYWFRCVYTEYDEIFRTYSDVGYETVRGYDVKLRHYPRHSRIQFGCCDHGRVLRPCLLIPSSSSFTLASISQR